MTSTYKTNRMNVTNYTYRSIAAKLSSYVEAHQKVRLVNSFAYQDPNRDRANLLFMKQFGVVPQELNSHHGEIDISNFSGLEAYDGLTILFESIFVSDAISSSAFTSKSQSEKMHTNIRRLAHKQSKYVEMYDMLNESHLNMIIQQTQNLARSIEIKRRDFRGGYIYISGFSCASSKQVNSEVIEQEFLPWYFELGGLYGMPKMFIQHEIDSLLRNLEEQPPLIANLDDFLDGMTRSDSHD